MVWPQEIGGAGAEKAVKRRVKARPYGRALWATLRVGV